MLISEVWAVCVHIPTEDVQEPEWVAIGRVLVVLAQGIGVKQENIVLLLHGSSFWLVIDIIACQIVVKSSDRRICRRVDAECAPLVALEVSLIIITVSW